MTFPAYVWPLTDQFVDRHGELDRLEAWWSGRDRSPINLYGRRRVGKSWLFRRFAHTKPAMLLVAERLASGAQLTRFARQISPYVNGVVPDLPDPGALVRTLLRLARDEPLLAVIDEFPWLLGSTGPEVERTLSVVQAALEEERDRSRLKLILCGSAVGQMEALQGERNPLHGRLIPMELRPFERAASSLMLPEERPEARFERYAIAGGMPRYLAAVRGPDLRDAICSELLRPDSPLWNEGRTIVGQELREPAVHFAVLEQLATGEKELGEIAARLRMDGGSISKYLAVLEGLRLVGRSLPFGASPSARSGHWGLRDPFLRFWFRFVFPFQSDLEAGLAPADLYDSEVAPALPEHVAPVFEEAARAHTRSVYGKTAPRVGRWWGNARHDLRRTGDRSTEEIDIVGVARNRVTIVGEARWTAKPMDVTILRDLLDFKVPALAQAGFRMAAHPHTVLYGKGGYTDGLRRAAEQDDHLILIDVADMLA